MAARRRCCRRLLFFKIKVRSQSCRSYPRWCPCKSMYCHTIQLKNTRISLNVEKRQVYFNLKLIMNISLEFLKHSLSSSNPFGLQVSAKQRKGSNYSWAVSSSKSSSWTDSTLLVLIDFFLVQSKLFTWSSVTKICNIVPQIIIEYQIQA